jgi:hypothetical protein
VVTGDQKVGCREQRERQEEPAPGARGGVPPDGAGREQGDADSPHDRHEPAVGGREHRAPEERTRAGCREPAEQREATSPGDRNELRAEQQHEDPGHGHQERGELGREAHELGAR